MSGRVEITEVGNRSDSPVHQNSFKTPNLINQRETAVPVELKCEECGENYERPPSKAEDSRFCSKECYLESGREYIECDFCGDKFKIKASHKGRRRFCSRKCLGKWMESTSGEETRRWEGGKEELICPICGDTFSEWPSVRRTTCSKECYIEYMSGPDGAVGEGGYRDHYYGANWRRQRRKALERDDYKCQRCGKTKEEIGQNPHVHHMIPFRKFDDCKEANKLENLVCLCNSCHQRVEGMPVIPEVVNN